MKNNIKNIIKAKIYNLKYHPKSEESLILLKFFFLISSVPFAFILKAYLISIDDYEFKLLLFFKFSICLSGFFIYFILEMKSTYFINLFFNNKNRLFELNKESEEDFSDEDISFIKENYDSLKIFDDELIENIIHHIDKYRFLFEDNKISFKEKVQNIAII